MSRSGTDGYAPLVEALAPFSHNKAHPRAEWTPSNGAVVHTDTCLCGHRGLVRNFTITNRFTGATLVVGSECVSQFDLLCIACKAPLKGIAARLERGATKCRDCKRDTYDCDSDFIDDGSLASDATDEAAEDGEEDEDSTEDAESGDGSKHSGADSGKNGEGDEGDDAEGDDAEGDDAEGNDAEGDDAEGNDAEGDDAEGDDAEGDDAEDGSKSGDTDASEDGDEDTKGFDPLSRVTEGTSSDSDSLDGFVVHRAAMRCKRLPASAFVVDDDDDDDDDDEIVDAGDGAGGADGVGGSGVDDDGGDGTGDGDDDDM